jgi:hypothetical protein
VINYNTHIIRKKYVLNQLTVSHVPFLIVKVVLKFTRRKLLITERSKLRDRDRALTLISFPRPVAQRLVAFQAF